MQAVRTGITWILAAGLLAGSASGVGAEESHETTLAASAFEATLGRPEESIFDASTGLESTVGIRVEATDPRASGFLSATSSAGVVCSESEVGAVVWGTTCGRPMQPLYLVVRASVRLSNDDGAWVGTQVYFTGAESDHDVFGGFMELTGTGSYAGLTMLATLEARGMELFTPRKVLGIIIPSEAAAAWPAAHSR